MKRIIFLTIFLLIALAMAIGWFGHGWWAATGAVIIIVMAGGAIAYLGDVIGYSFGKKRKTLFNFRPRTTATIIGVTAGSLSALAAFGMLLVVNYSFREALVRGNELAHNLVMLKQQNATYQRQIARSATQLAQAVADKSQAKSEADQAKELEVAAQQGLAKARVELAGARAEYDVARTALATAQSQLGSTRAELAVAQNNLRGRQVALDRAAADLKSASRTLRVAEMRASDLELKNEEALRRLNLTRSQTIPTIEAARSSDIVYRNGQEVGRSVIKNGSTSAILKSLNAFLDTLGQQAQAAGATPVTGGRAVKLATIELTAATGSQGPGADQPAFASESDSLDALAEQIHGTAFDSVVVLAYAYGNSFPGERVVLRLRPYRNRLAVAEGTTLGETTIHNAGEVDPIVLMNDIQQMLVAKVRPAAISAGVIPVLESAHAQAQLGDLPVSDVIKLVQQIEVYKGDAIVTAAAATDVWSADKLRLRFTVRPVALPVAATPTSAAAGTN